MIGFGANKQAWLYAVLSAYFVVVGIVACWVVGSTVLWWAVWPITFLASLPIQAWVRAELEGRAPVDDPNIRSLTSCIGQPLVLPSVVLVLAYGAHISGNIDYGSSLWAFICMMIGFAGGPLFAFHEQERYQQRGASDVMESPSKMTENLVTWPTFTSMILFLAVPLLGSFDQAWPWLLVATMLLALYGFLGRCDRWRAIHPYDLYVAWDPEAFEPK